MGRPKLAARIIRAAFYSAIFGPVLFLIAYFMGAAINQVAGSSVVNPTALGLGLFGIGFAAPIAIELSKDIEAEEQS